MEVQTRGLPRYICIAVHKYIATFTFIIYTQACNYCVVPENIHTPPQKGLEIPGGGGGEGGISKSENFEEMCGM